MNRSWKAIALAVGLVAGAGLALGWLIFRPEPVPADADSSPPRAPEGRMGGRGRGAATSLAVPPQRASIPFEGPCRIRLHDVTAQTGIGFVHTDGSSGRRYIMEAMSAGLALVDYDRDGLIDLYFPNGAPLLGGQAQTSEVWETSEVFAAAPLPAAKSDKPPRHALYKNLGGWRFQDVAEQAGVACTAFGLGVAVGDYDNDGWPDVYLSNFGPNVLYRNRGDGTFADATELAGVGRGNRVGAGACFLDVDGDGHLDLFVGNYVVFSYQTHKMRVLDGVPFYPGPLDHAPETNTLYRNRGDGTLADVSADWGVADHPGTAMGTIACDYDDDGRTDVFVANDEMPDFLFHNDGRGKLEEVAIPSGVAFNPAGLPQGSMGVDCGDFDRDGRLDFYVTAYQHELVTLFRNLGDRFFLDVAHATGAGEGAYSHVTWGCGLVDLDNDGDLDVFIACGHTDDTIELRDRSASYRDRNLVLLNLLAETGTARFVNVSDRCGDGLRVKAVSRGAAFDDLDNDGDLDVVVLNSRSRPTVLRNMLRESGSKNHWIQVRLAGVKTNRDGVGARVRVTAGDLAQIDEVHSGRGYQSHWGSRLHFGLGPRSRIDRLEVRWIGGGVDVLENVAVDQVLTVHEGAHPAREATAQE